MANQRLFLTEIIEEETRLGNSMSTSYLFDGERLKVFWKNKKAYDKPASIGDGYVVKCRGSAPEVLRLKTPRGREATVMWLCYFNNPDRTFSIEDYEELIEKRRELHRWWNYEEYTHGNRDIGWEYKLCNRSDCGGICRIAAYVKKGASDEVLEEFIKDYAATRGLSFPQEFVEKTLRDIGLNLDLSFAF